MQQPQDSFSPEDLQMQMAHQQQLAMRASMTQSKMNSYYIDPDGFYEKYGRSGIAALQNEADALGLVFKPTGIEGDAARVFLNNLVPFGLLGTAASAFGYDEFAEADKYQIGSAAKMAGIGGMAAGALVPGMAGAKAVAALLRARRISKFLQKGGSAVKGKELTKVMEGWRTSGGDLTKVNDDFIRHIDDVMENKVAARARDAEGTLVEQSKGWFRRFTSGEANVVPGKTIAKLKMEAMEAAAKAQKAGKTGAAAAKTLTDADRLRVMDKLENAYNALEVGMMPTGQRMLGAGVGVGLSEAARATSVGMADEPLKSPVDRFYEAASGGVHSGMVAGGSTVGLGVMARASLPVRGLIGGSAIGYGVANESPELALMGAGLLVPGVRYKPKATAVSVATGPGTPAKTGINFAANLAHAPTNVEVGPRLQSIRESIRRMVRAGETESAIDSRLRRISGNIPQDGILPVRPRGDAAGIDRNFVTGRPTPGDVAREGILLHRLSPIWNPSRSGPGGLKFPQQGEVGVPPATSANAPRTPIFRERAEGARRLSYAKWQAEVSRVFKKLDSGLPITDEERAIVAEFLRRVKRK